MSHLLPSCTRMKHLPASIARLNFHRTAAPFRVFLGNAGELVIGLPSTYASNPLQVLKDRRFVRLDKKRCIPTTRAGCCRVP